MSPLFKSLKKIANGADSVDVVIFCLVLFAFPPLALIWLAVRVIQEWE